MLRRTGISLKWVARPIRRHRTITAFCALFAAMLLYRQPISPAPWFDEGLNVSTAATLARSGLYALPDALGPRVLDPAIQTGPPVIVPIAVVFDLFGVDLFHARLVIVFFALVAIIAYWQIAYRLVGLRAAVMAMVFVLAGTAEQLASFVPMSRQVLGEAPALAYLLLGIVIWFRAIEDGRPGAAPWLLSGLAWGIAMVTKSQVMITFPVALAGIALLDWLYYRQANWWAFIVPGAVAVSCVGAWYAAQWVIAGPVLFQQNAEVLREGSRLHVLEANPAHWRNAIGAIWRTGFWLWGAPAILWGIWQARQRNFTGLQHAWILAVVLVMLAWFAILSIGWARYIFFPVVLTPIWLGGLTGWLIRSFPWQSRVVTVIAIVGAIAASSLLVNVRYRVAELLAPDNGYQAMRVYLMTRVPHDAVIETWEWEFSLDAIQPIHHPPTEITNLYTAYIQSRRSAPPDLYDPLRARPDYVLTGGFSTLTQIYARFLENCPSPVVELGAYSLFRVASCNIDPPAGNPQR